MKNTLVEYFKTLKVIPQKTEDGYIIVYASRALRMGLAGISPKPTKEELEEAIAWLEENKLAMSLGNRNSDAVISELVRLEK